MKYEHTASAVVPNVPSDKDWGGDTDDLDAQWAREKFFGADPQKAWALFEHDVVAAAEHIEHMPPIPFRYYLYLLGRYVCELSESNDNAADAASNFLRSVLYNLQLHRDRIMPAIPILIQLVRAVAANQEMYDAPESIYGNFVDLESQIGQLAK